MFFQFFLHYKESSLGIMPSVTIVYYFRLYQRNLKNLHLFIRFSPTFTSIISMGTSIGITWTGICIERSRFKVFYKIRPFQFCWLNLVITFIINDSQRWLQWSFSRFTLNKIRISRMFLFFLWRKNSVF